MSAETSWVTCFNPFIDILFWWLVTSVYVKGCSWSAEKNCICGNELFEGAALFCEILCETREILHGNFLSWLPRLMVRMLWNVPCSMSGLPGSKRDDNQRKMMSIPEDHQCWLMTPYIETVNDLVHANQRLTVREFAEECGISIGSCYETLTEKLRMHWVATKFVLRLMTADQKQQSNSSLLGTVWSSWRGCNLVTGS